MTSATGAPISSHPAFAPAVGLWFAALLGFGLLVMSADLHAMIAARTGLETLLPEDVDARMANSAIAALAGFLLGLAIARRAARANDEIDPDDWEIFPPEDSVWLGEKASPEPPVEDSAPFAHRLFNPREELDEEGIGVRPAPEEPQHPGESALMEAWRLEREESTEVSAEESPDEASADAEIPECDPAPLSAEPLDDPEAPDAQGEASLPGAGERANEPAPDAPGDLPLAALTARLEQAIAEHRRQVRAPSPAQEAEPAPIAPAADPVIAFLRREADRSGVRMDGAGELGDPQAVLRSALDKLSRASNPK